MAIKTTWTCDRCGHTQDNDDQMWNVGIAVNAVRVPLSVNQHKQLWCRKCVVGIGLLPPATISKGVEPPAAPTFDDLLRDIIREEIDTSR